MGRPLREVYPHATRWQVLKWKVSEFLKLCVRIITWTGATGAILYTTFLAGAYFNPVVSYATQEKEVLVKADTPDAPVLDRIAGCESQGDRKSKGAQYGKDGQVIVRANTNGSVDIGRYQINEKVWGAKATELGLNLFVEADNKKMAEWIYANKGTEPWYPSKACWN